MDPERVSDERLMAWADGELDTAARAEVELALAADPALAARALRAQALRSRLQAAFEPVLHEPVPERLLRLLPAAADADADTGAGAAASQPPAVVDLQAARARRDGGRDRPLARAAGGWGWAQWGGMAASVALGVALGLRWAGPGGEADFDGRGGSLLAAGSLERALTAQLASAPQAAAPLAVQLSFVDKAGAYCRTFSTPALAGLACRQGSAWAVQALAAVAPASASTGARADTAALRQAASSLPRSVLDAVDSRIQGATLDAAGERAARDAGWRR